MALRSRMSRDGMLRLAGDSEPLSLGLPQASFAYLDFRRFSRVASCSRCTCASIRRQVLLNWPVRPATARTITLYSTFGGGSNGDYTNDIAHRQLRAHNRDGCDLLQRLPHHPWRL